MCNEIAMQRIGAYKTAFWPLYGWNAMLCYIILSKARPHMMDFGPQQGPDFTEDPPGKVRAAVGKLRFCEF